MSLSTSLVWRGLLAVGIGVVSIVWPNVTVGAFVILFAVYAFLMAGTDAMLAFSSDRVGPVVGYLLLAVLSLAAGIAAIVWPGITALMLTIWVAVWAVVTGVIEVAMTFRQEQPAGQRAMWVLTGIISIVFGGALFYRPDIGALSLATVFGLFSIFYGASTLALSFQVRQMKSAARRVAGSAA
jgi:uncharacterized membrane protein HdeD (DUF308 family)